jgi:Uma2 family endonuclease
MGSTMEIKDISAAYKLQKKVFTYQDYLDLPEDGNRFEVINGELIMVAAPNISHQFVSGNIYLALYNFVQKKQLGRILYAPADVVLSKSNVVQPDILFISKENSSIITEKNIAGAPDLIIEIISPSSAYYDLLEKKELYATHGVKEYWIVEPKKQWIEVYINQNGKFELDQRVEQTGIVRSIIVKNWTLNLDKAFNF